MIPEDLRYTKEHEWMRVSNGVGVVGITHFAQDQLGDIVFVELPEVGRRLEANKSFGVVESVKTVSELYAPVSGEVVEVNPRLVGDGGQPELVNSDPYGDGWMIKLKLDNPGDVTALLDATAYTELAR
ncbi:MAG: glycine cleavage system protein GcvH [Candidatus Eremiobacterota bacterium]